VCVNPREDRKLKKLTRGGGLVLQALLGATLSGVIALQVAVAQVRLPDFGDSSSDTFSGLDDHRLGEAFMREVRASLEVLDDPVVDRYVQSVGYRISSVSDIGGSGFRFFVVDEPTINAFAGPGGHIGINTGLIMAAEFEGELASVMAHEIAHVTQRHLARAFEFADQTAIPVMAGILAGAILGLANPQAGQATIAAVSGVSVQKQLDFTRANELEADRVGMQLLSKADFDPQAMPAFFEKLQTATRYSRRPPEYLSTHPVTSSRIADTRSRAESFPYKQHADSEEFHLVKARLAVRQAKDVKAVTERFADRLQSGAYRNLAATAYGWGLGLLRQNKAEQAEAIFAKLQTNHPGQTAFAAALGESILEQGDIARGLATFSEAARLFPDDQVILRGRAEALVRAGHGEALLATLADYERLHDKDAALYKLEAQAYQLLGRVAESQLALAEHFYLSGKVGAAIHQLRQAADRGEADYFVGSRVTARLRELEKEQAQRTGKK